MNSDGGRKEAEIDNGKGEKGEMFNVEDGSEKQSKRDDTDEAVAKEHGEKTIGDLPGELLVKILEMVPISQWATLESVSHQFQAVVHGLWGEMNEIRLDELAYNEEEKKANPYQVAESILEKILLRASNITSISGFKEFFNQDTPYRLETIQLLSEFKHLESIDFSLRNTISMGNFALFLESSASRQWWKSLDLVGGIYGNIQSHQAACSQGNQSALKLESFKFKMENLRIFDRFLHPIEWSALKTLVIVDAFWDEKEVLTIIRQCNQIGHLEVEVRGCRNELSFGKCMQAVGDLQNLSVLKLNVNYLAFNIPAVLLVLIQDLGRRDRFVDLALTSEFPCNDQLLGAIIDHLKHLKSLDLRVDCSTPLLVRLANRMVQLETLKLHTYYTSKIDGVVVRGIGGNMSKLQCLHLGELDATLEDLNCLVDLRMLKELCIEESLVESGTIETWTRLSFGSHLETLKLVQEGISPKILADFFKIMPRLRCLRLTRASDHILEVIGRSCPNLVKLDVVAWSSITTGIQSVIDRCSQLKILNVCGREWCPAALKVGKYRKITFK